MSKSYDEDVELKDETQETEEVVETTNVENEQEPEVQEQEVEQDEDDTESHETVAKEQKVTQEEADAELDEFFEKLRRNKEKQSKEKGEKTFTQAEFDKALKSALAKKLPPKEEMEQYRKWRESQQTMEEKMSNLRVKNSELTKELESLRHENLVIKSGVEKEAVEFVQYKVERMDGDFEDNLQDYLKEHKKYVTPKTTVVEAAEHRAKPKAGISKKELDSMDYVERTKYKAEHPDEYAKAMGR